MTRMSKLLYTLALLLVGSLGAVAQQGELRGRVTDLSGEALAGVNIRIDGTTQGTTTDTKGSYRLQGLSTEPMRLVFTYLGYGSVVREVRLRFERGREGDKHDHLDVVMVEDQQTLQPVEIVGRSERGYRNSQSFSGTKTALAIRDIPQSIGYVTKELALDQGATTINEVVKNVSGITQFTFYNDFSIRGFRVQGNRNSGNLVNGMRAQTSFWKAQSIANIERVEIIKGPASALFGNASPGGVINRVTKKPLPKAQHTLSASVGSFNTLGLQGDFTGPLSSDRSLLYRLNLGYDTSDTFRDQQHSSSLIVAPSISFLPSERTRLNLDLVYQGSDGKLDRGQTIFSPDNLYTTPISQSINATDDYLKEKFLHLTLSASQELAKGLLLNAVYMRSTYDEDLREHLTGGYALKADRTPDTTKAAMQARIRQRSFRNNSFNVYLNYDLDLGFAHNHFLVGYDYFQTDLLPGASQYDALSYKLNTGKTANTFTARNVLLDADGNPTYNVPFFDLTQGTLSNKLGNIPSLMASYIWTERGTSPYRQYSHAWYVQNQIELGALKVLLGLRQEIFTDILNRGLTTQTTVQQRALLPRVGLVYSLSKAINLYASWIKGYDPQSASVQSNPNSGGPFGPTRSELIEVGAKTDWLDQRLSATLAVFRLRQEGTLYKAGDTSNPDLQTQIGRETSRGIEIDVVGYVLPEWSITASYAYNDAKIAETMISAEKNIQKPNTPLHSANVWSKYVFRHGPLRHFGFGLGANYVDSRHGQIDRANPIVLPHYWLMDAALYYRTNRIQVQLNINNILDKKHWVGGYDTVRVYPGAPRNVKATLTYRF